MEFKTLRTKFETEQPELSLPTPLPIRAKMEFEKTV
jgi:hypothetical protein